MKNVLFIVYYFPPMGGSGVQRPLKFVKYLSDFGWNPIVLCPEPGMYPHFDESLQEELEEISPEIIRVQPKTLFHIGAGSASQKKKNIPDWFARIVRRFLRLFMYPDNKKGWIDPAVKAGLRAVSENKIDLIFSTAPPFSNHIVGQEISRETKLPLVLDYRDAWLNNHFMDGMFSWQKNKMKTLEAACLEEADIVLGLDDFMLSEMKSTYPNIADKAEVIPHGFDPADFEAEVTATLEYKEGKLNFLYSGLFYESNQPDIFLAALLKAHQSELLHKEEVHLHFQGGLDQRIKQKISRLGLEEIVTDYGYLEHKKAVANLEKADVLWMISSFDKVHKQVKSGKLFEYFGSGKPVLGLVHEGVEAEFLRKYGAGYIGNITSVEELAFSLGEIYEEWKSDKLRKPKQAFIDTFNRKKLTKQLAHIFDKISVQ